MNCALLTPVSGNMNGAEYFGSKLTGNKHSHVSELDCAMIDRQLEVGLYICVCVFGGSQNR